MGEDKRVTESPIVMYPSNDARVSKVLHVLNGGIRTYYVYGMNWSTVDTSQKEERTRYDLRRILAHRAPSDKNQGDLSCLAKSAIFRLEQSVETVFDTTWFMRTIDWMCHQVKGGISPNFILEIVTEKNVIFSWPVRSARYFCMIGYREARESVIPFGGFRRDRRSYVRKKGKNISPGGRI